jgi:hypothetical protein
MSDRLEGELTLLKRRRAAMKKDLDTLAVKLSATSQIVIMREIAILDNEIREMTEEIETMAFEQFMKEKWNDGR